MAGKGKGKGKKKTKPKISEISAGSAIASTETAVAKDEVTAKMKELVLRHYLNPKYSDLTIICNGEIFPAHRNIVCPQSMYFENACDGRFRESNGEVILEDRDPILVRKMLEFLYTGDYTFEAPNAKGSFKSENTSGEVSHTDLDQDLQVSQGETSSAHPRTDQAFFHAQMYAQGAYFQIEGLKMKAKEYFRESFMKFTDRESYTSAVLEVYGSTEDHNRGLRDLVVQMTTDNLLLLRANNNPILDGIFLEAVPNFMLEICLSALDRCAKHQGEYRGWSYYN